MTAIVFGAAKPGYAEAITKQLIENGYSVIGTYDAAYQENAELLLEEFHDNLKLHKVDLSSKSALKNFTNSIKDKIDAIVFAQFYFEMENPENYDYTIWDKSIAINLSAPNMVVHELQSKMNNNSSIVIITSTEGFRGSYGAPAYAATKAGIHNLVKTLANILGKYQIRINALPAGWIGGEMDTDDIFNKSRELTPLGRLGKDSEIADITMFLLSEKSSFINGTTIVADGGYLCSDPLSKYEFEDFISER